MASLNEKIETLTVQLGLTRGAPAAQAIAQALKTLGLEERASNLNLVEQADLCLATLGSTPSASATAPSQPAPVVVQGAVVVPSPNAEPPIWGWCFQRARHRSRRSLLGRSRSLLRPTRHMASRRTAAPCIHRTGSRRSLLRRSPWPLQCRSRSA